MTKELLEVLEALCSMWEQYCGGKYGHKCMSAGEEAEEVLNKHNLLIFKKGYQRDINYQQLEQYRNQVNQQPHDTIT